jgi:hypothetical protein
MTADSGRGMCALNLRLGGGLSPLDEAKVYLAYEMPWLAVRRLTAAIDEAASDGLDELRSQLAEIEHAHPNWRELEAFHEHVEQAATPGCGAPTLAQ